MDTEIFSELRNSTPIRRPITLENIIVLCNYLSNRPQVPVGYELINHAGCW